jgi:hypothetical protein
MALITVEANDFGSDFRGVFHVTLNLLAGIGVGLAGVSVGELTLESRAVRNGLVHNHDRLHLLGECECDAPHTVLLERVNEVVNL